MVAEGRRGTGGTVVISKGIKGQNFKLTAGVFKGPACTLSPLKLSYHLLIYRNLQKENKVLCLETTYIFIKKR